MLRSTLAVVLLLTGLATLQAQMMQLGGSGYTPKYPVLLMKTVQQELKLSEEQNKKIIAKVKELMPEGSVMRLPGEKDKKDADGNPQVLMSFTFKSAGGGPPAAGGVAIDPSKIGLPPMPDFKKIDEEVSKLLDQPQRDRLRQIMLQRVGITSLAQDDVARDVELEPEQKELIKHILDDQRQKLSEAVQKMLQEGSMQQEKMVELMKKLREETEKDIGLLLTPVQQSKWEELQGAKFDLKK